MLPKPQKKWSVAEHRYTVPPLIWEDISVRPLLYHSMNPQTLKYPFLHCYFSFFFFLFFFYRWCRISCEPYAPCGRCGTRRHVTTANSSHVPSGPHGPTLKPRIRYIHFALREFFFCKTRCGSMGGWRWETTDCYYMIKRLWPFARDDDWAWGDVRSSSWATMKPLDEKVGVPFGETGTKRRWTYVLTLILMQSRYESESPW